MNSIRRALAALVTLIALTASLLATGAVSTSAQADSSFPNGQDPVVLVHGLFGAPWNWNTLRDKLIASGYTSDQIITFGYNSTGQSNVRTSHKLATAIDDVLARTGADKVDIIGHSMGGLNSRWCIKYDGCGGKVDDWVSLAGPNNGTANTGLCWYLITCREMAPGSSFITKLNAGPTLPADVSGTVVWSPNDGVVTPATSTVLPGVEVFEVPGVTHLGMLTDAKVAGIAMDAISD